MDELIFLLLEQVVINDAVEFLTLHPYVLSLNDCRRHFLLMSMVHIEYVMEFSTMHPLRNQPK
jgi:hypothetical protein